MILFVSSVSTWGDWLSRAICLKESCHWDHWGHSNSTSWMDNERMLFADKNSSGEQEVRNSENVWRQMQFMSRSICNSFRWSRIRFCWAAQLQSKNAEFDASSQFITLLQYPICLRQGLMWHCTVRQELAQAFLCTAHIRVWAQGYRCAVALSNCGRTEKQQLYACWQGFYGLCSVT